MPNADDDQVPAVTVDQMMWQIQRAIEGTRKTCAEIADAYLDASHVDGDRIYRNGWRACAATISARIRAL
jgi:hypothetical protein